MSRKFLIPLIAGVLFITGITMVSAQTTKTKLPIIPGVTATDTHPNGCIDCHRNIPNVADYSLSHAISEWAAKGTPKEIMDRAKSAWPKANLSGKHPNVVGMIKSKGIPASCFVCHDSDNSDKPLYRVLHTIHYTGGADNHFITKYNGSCTNCHNINLKNPPTGTMEVKEGKEK